MLAHISGDKHMIGAFRTGQDIHAATASKVYHLPIEEITSTMRSSCKAVNFGIVYGISDFSLAQDIGVSRKEAAAFIRSYLDSYPGVENYMETIKETAREQGCSAAAVRCLTSTAKTSTSARLPSGSR